MLIKQKWQKAKDVCQAQWRAKYPIPAAAAVGTLMAFAVAHKENLGTGPTEGYLLLGLVGGAFCGVILTIADPLRGIDVICPPPKSSNPIDPQRVLEETFMGNQKLKAWSRDLRLRAIKASRPPPPQ